MKKIIALTLALSAMTLANGATTRIPYSMEYRQGGTVLKETSAVNLGGLSSKSSRGSEQTVKAQCNGSPIDVVLGTGVKTEVTATTLVADTVKYEFAVNVTEALPGVLDGTATGCTSAELTKTTAFHEHASTRQGDRTSLDIAYNGGTYQLQIQP